MTLGDARCYPVEQIRTLKPKNSMISTMAPNPAFGTTTIEDGVTLRVTLFFVGEWLRLNCRSCGSCCNGADISESFNSSEALIAASRAATGLPSSTSSNVLTRTYPIAHMLARLIVRDSTGESLQITGIRRCRAILVPLRHHEAMWHVLCCNKGDGVFRDGQAPRESLACIDTQIIW